MRVKQKSWETIIPQSVEKVWAFFSRPENLDVVTPKDMHFEILSDIANVPMYEGMVIQYKVSPFLGIKMNWVTEITHAKELEYFIDEQRFGPYAFWHHQHHFEVTNDGTLMKDILHYKVPYGIIGNIADAVFVDAKIEAIFSFREQKIRELFYS